MFTRFIIIIKHLSDMTLCCTTVKLLIIFNTIFSCVKTKVIVSDILCKVNLRHKGVVFNQTFLRACLLKMLRTTKSVFLVLQYILYHELKKEKNISSKKKIFVSEIHVAQKGVFSSSDPQGRFYLCLNRLFQLWRVAMAHDNAAYNVRLISLIRVQIVVVFLVTWPCAP